MIGNMEESLIPDVMNDTGGSRRGFLEDIEGFLIRAIEDRVILTIMDHVFSP